MQTISFQQSQLLFADPATFAINIKAIFRTRFLQLIYQLGLAIEKEMNIKSHLDSPHSFTESSQEHLKALLEDASREVAFRQNRAATFKTDVTKLLDAFDNSFRTFRHGERLIRYANMLLDMSARTE